MAFWQVSFCEVITLCWEGILAFVQVVLGRKGTLLARVAEVNDMIAGIAA